MAKATAKKKNQPTSRFLPLAEKAIYICIIATVLLAMAKFGLYSVSNNQLINEDTYQAVTLSNGQTFFGKLKDNTLGNYVLIDVYYIQSQPNEDATSEQVNVQTQLVPLTSDIHQPYNHIVLNRKHIIAWQNLQPSSPILNAISDLNTN